MLQLKKFPDIPVDTREEARDSAHIQRRPVSACSLERRDPFPAWSGKNSRRSRRISRGGALHRKGERNSRVVPPFPDAPDFSVHYRETCFPCTASTFKPRIDSHNGGTWESLQAKLFKRIHQVEIFVIEGSKSRYSLSFTFRSKLYFNLSLQGFQSYSFKKAHQHRLQSTPLALRKHCVFSINIVRK